MKKLLKKSFSLLLSLFTIFALTACGQTPAADEIKTSVLDADEVKVARSEEYRDLQYFEVIPQDVALFIQNDQSVKLIDVREPEEYKESHIENSINISLNQLSRASLETSGITPIDNIVLYCLSGNRSAQAYAIMQSLGYYNSNSMAGGITKWTEVGLPVE